MDLKVNMNPRVMFWRALVRVQDALGVEPSLEKLSSVIFRARFGKPLDLDNPRDLNEKINWLKFRSDTSMWPMLADKYAVREWVAEKGLGNILTPLLGVWDKAEDISFDGLPDSFVLKTTNGSGANVIVQDKASADLTAIRRKFAKSLKKHFGLREGEPHYLKIRSRVIAEPLLDDRNTFSTSIVDYKVWCLGGKPEFTLAIYNRPSPLVLEAYDNDWKFIPEACVASGIYHTGSGNVPRPPHFEDMLKAAAVLCEGFPQVRVDFYDTPEGIFFGEMTLSSAGGMMPYFSSGWLESTGNKVDISSL